MCLGRCSGSLAAACIQAMADTEVGRWLDGTTLAASNGGVCHRDCHRPIETRKALCGSSCGGAVARTPPNCAAALVLHNSFGLTETYFYLFTLSLVDESGLSRTYSRPLILTTCAPGCFPCFTSLTAVRRGTVFREPILYVSFRPPGPSLFPIILVMTQPP